MSMELKNVIAETLSPYASIRKAAEDRLGAARTVPGHPVEVLKLVASLDTSETAVRQAAAVHFKNTIKKGWDLQREEGNDGIVISEQDRTTIKSHLVQLMCTVPHQIQAQLSESISLIAKVDYPQHWENLLPELVQQFSCPDPAVVIGVLTTADSIFEGFRHVERSDDLYKVILYTLNIIQAPLLTLFKTTSQAIDGFANDPLQLKPRFEALRLLCSIFYSLNYQDLPEFFEDHIEQFMTEFAKYLQYQNPALVGDSESNEPGPIDQVQTAIIQNLSLYTGKDEECFMQYLGNFTSLVWHLLMGITSYPKHDPLATTSIKFLSSLVSKLMHKALFSEESTLRQIILKIVIPNLTFREIDVERFEDDPHEYILTEVEGSDSESRRRCSRDLLREMCRHFEKETTAIVSENVGFMLAEFHSDPVEKWTAKDAAINLLAGIAIRLESSKGVSQVNEAVNVMDFFHAHILPELQDTNHRIRPVVKATSLKFVCTFRNQFSKDQLCQLFPLIIGHLSSPVVVVHTFAAYSFERIISSKDTNGIKRFTASDLQPFLEPLFAGLFTIVDNEELNENDYVMKCVMRALAAAEESVLPVTQIVIGKLTGALGRVARNPRNPQFNHYLFESVAVLVSSVCSRDAGATAGFETLLFPPFNVVLQMDISEFTPYVFQIMAQLLEYRPSDAGLGDAFRGLLNPLLTPSIWEKRGNVPALARLLQAYIQKASNELVPKINPILGVFQKLLTLKATEASSFEIVNAAIVYFPKAEMESKLDTILRLLLTRLQAGKTPRYMALVTTCFAILVGKFGPQAFQTRLDGIQHGLSRMVVKEVWNARIATAPPVGRSEAKIHVVGLTRILLESNALLSDPESQVIWGEGLAGLVSLLSSSSFRSTTEKSTIDDDVEIEVSYDAHFSRLVYATRSADDMFPEIVDPTAFFVQSLHRLIASQPGLLVPLVQQALSVDPKLSAGLESMFKQAGLSLA